MNVEDLIKNSLQKLQEIGWEKRTPNDEQKKRKLIFPSYRVEKNEKADEEKHKRISEQEARFLFVRELEIAENTDFYYSVETPTKKTYKFSKKDDKDYQPQIVSVENGGQSASVDVTLYEKRTDNFKRNHLIEFKFGNVETCKKDFLKLLYDLDGLYNYYINILDVKNLSIENEGDRTFKSVKKKYKKAIEYLVGVESEQKSILKIILFNINGDDMIFFEDIDMKMGKTEIEIEKIEKIVKKL